MSAASLQRKLDGLDGSAEKISALSQYMRLREADAAEVARQSPLKCRSQHNALNRRYRPSPPAARHRQKW